MKPSRYRLTGTGAAQAEAMARDEALLRAFAGALCEGKPWEEFDRLAADHGLDGPAARILMLMHFQEDVQRRESLN